MMTAPDWMRRGVRQLEGAQRLDPAIDRLRPIAGKVVSGDRGSALRGEWLGHALHPLLTDFPLGCWIGAGLLDLLGGRRARPAAQRLVGLGLLFVPVTAASGWADWGATDDQRVRRVGVVHAAGNGVAAVMYLRSWRARRRGHHLRGVAWSMIANVLAWITGYLGGHMSFARGSGVGERGLEEPGTFAMVIDEDELLDIAAAAVVLDVEPEQVEAMMLAELLVPVGDGEGPVRFRRADLLAARLVGG